MTELICNQGHVLDPGHPTCSRCGGLPIGTAEVAPVINEAPVADAPRDLDTLTKKEIEAELTVLGVEFKSSESKAELVKKLKEAVEADAEEVDESEDEAEGEDEESDEDSDSEDEL